MALRPREWLVKHLGHHANGFNRAKYFVMETLRAAAPRVVASRDNRRPGSPLRVNPVSELGATRFVPVGSYQSQIM